MEVSAIYETLEGLIRGGELRLPAGAFGPGPLEDALAECCDGGELRVEPVSLRETPTEVHLSGTGAGRPFSAMALEGRFAPAPGGDGALMTLKAHPPSGWTLAASWPSLSSSILSQLVVSEALLSLGTGIAGEAKQGLALDGTIEPGTASPWRSLGWLVDDVGTLAGPVSVVAGVPVFSMTAPAKQFSIPVLGELTPTVTLACTALKLAPGTAGQPAYAPVPELSLGATLGLGPGVPISIDLSNPIGLIGVSADVTKLGDATLEEVGKLVGVDDLAGFLPSASGFDPARAVQLADLEFTINPKQRKVVSTGIELVTSLHWAPAEHIELEEVGFRLVVPVDPPPGAPTVFAAVFGKVSWPGGGLDISGAHSDDFQLAAGLSAGSKIKVTDLLDLFLPTQLDAELYLDELEMLAATSGSWSLIAGLEGDWEFSVGIVGVALEEAWIQLEHGAGVTGAISATAQLGSDKNAPQFTGLWTLPGSFALHGSFGETSLGDLAGRLTGVQPPSGLPEVTLTKAEARLSLSPGEDRYDFALAATAAMAPHGELGQGAFEVRKDNTGFGFLVGVALSTGWSPGEVWSQLSDIFGALQLDEAGLVVSTLPSTAPDLKILSMPSVPAQVGQGVTFFASLALEKAGIGFLSEVLPPGTTLDLLAVIDSAAPGESRVSALLRERAGKADVEFQRLSLTFRLNPLSVALSAQAVLHLEQGEAKEEVTLGGAGTIEFEQPGFELELSIAHWPEPFGIKRLTVEKFGLDLSVEDDMVHVGALGEILVGQGREEFTLEIGADFEGFDAPDAIVFELRDEPGKTLMLSSVIEEFTTFDVSKVPVLGGVGFKKLSLWMVGNPSGWTIDGYTFTPGIAIHADVSLYGWGLTLDVEVHTDKGVKAAGAVDKPIEVGGVLTISGGKGQTGPAAEIDTSPSPTAPAQGGRPGAYLWLDGEVSLLGVKQRVRAEVTHEDLELEIEFDFIAAVPVTLECTLSGGKSFSASADFSFDVDVTLGPFSWHGVELVPRVHISGPRGAAAIAIAVEESSGFDLKFDLAFDWGSIHVHVSPELTAADLGDELANLWSAVVTWMEGHLEEVFSELLKDASKWVDAIKSGLIELGATAKQLAEALAGYFEVTAEKAAELLKELGFGFEEIVEALESAFDLSVNEATQLLSDLTKDCSISSAYAELSPGGREAEIPRTLFDLTGSPTGERMLFRYYSHRAELASLTRRLPEVAARVGTVSVPEEPDADARAVVSAGSEALRALRLHASPELRAAIDETLPELDRRAGMTYEEFMEDLRR